MRRSLAVALAALLATVSVAVAVPLGSQSGSVSPFTIPDVGATAGQSHSPASAASSRPAATAATPVVPDTNTTHYLALPPDDIQTEGFGTVTISVSSALAADASRLNASFSRRQLGAAYANAETAAERRLVLRLAATRVATRIDRIERREREALEAYNAGALSTREYLRELAVVDARSEALQQVVRDLERLAGQVKDPPITQSQVSQLEARLLPLQGPIRGHVRQVVSGDRDQPLRVYVETSPDGLVLARIVETDAGVQYVREAYVAGNRRPTAPDTFDGNIFAAQERIQRLYSWAFAIENHDGFSTRNTHLGQVAVYQFTVDHDHGQLTVFLDGGTNTTFLEYQRKTVSQIPTRAPVTAASNGLRLQVNRTRTGGPLEIRVVDNGTGEPVDARITIDEEVIGRTGADGRLWTIGPPVRFTVTATAAGRRVSVDTFSRRGAG